MEKLLVRGARVVDPAQGLDGVRDVLLEDGRVAAIGEVLPGREDIDGHGLVLAPGLVDMHVHLRDPGFPEKEDILSGAAAAAAGGFTSVACMANTKPVCDNPETLAYILEKARAADCRVYPMAAVTKGMMGEALTDQRMLKKAGAVAVSDDGKPIANNRLLSLALDEAKREKILLSYHAEDLSITGPGILHEGEISRRIQAPGVDRASEDVSTAAVLALAMDADAPVHLCHVSTQGSLAMIRDAKRRGVKVTCETAPHYFTLTHEKLLAKDANFRMAPPLREESDRKAVLEAIADGTVDCIATDHAPHSAADKADFAKAPNGIVGLETSLALCITKLVRPGVIPLARLIEMMSTVPARLLGIPGGTLREGSPADLVLFDPAESWVVDRHKFRSRGRNTPFDRMEVTGRVKYTILGGRIVYADTTNI